MVIILTFFHKRLNLITLLLFLESLQKKLNLESRKFDQIWETKRTIINNRVSTLKTIRKFVKKFK